MLFLLKIAVPPVLVALMSLAARLWGPTIGGLLMGLPWMTGPVLFFLALDKGDAFGAGACVGIELGVVSIAAFMFAYALFSAVARWPLCLLAAGLAFMVTAGLTQGIATSLWQAAGLGALSLLVSILLLPRPRAATVPALPPWWDIPARMLATFVLVGIIMVSADALGPTLSGIISTYPALLSVIGAFTHQQWGRDAVLRVLRGLAVSLLGFVVFFLIVGESLPRIGLIPAFALACAAAIPIHAGLTAITRRRAR